MNVLPKKRESCMIMGTVKNVVRGWGTRSSNHQSDSELPVKLTEFAITAWKGKALDDSQRCISKASMYILFLLQHHQISAKRCQHWDSD